MRLVTVGHGKSHTHLCQLLWVSPLSCGLGAANGTGACNHTGCFVRSKATSSRRARGCRWTSCFATSTDCRRAAALLDGDLGLVLHSMVLVRELYCCRGEQEMSATSTIKNNLQRRKTESWSCFGEGKRLQITSNGE